MPRSLVLLVLLAFQVCASASTLVSKTDVLSPPEKSDPGPAFRSPSNMHATRDLCARCWSLCHVTCERR